MTRYGTKTHHPLTPPAKSVIVTGELLFTTTLHFPTQVHVPNSLTRHIHAHIYVYNGEKWNQSVQLRFDERERESFPKSKQTFSTHLMVLCNPPTLETAAEAALWLDYFCPPLDQEKDAHQYLWTVWYIMLSIAQSPDVTSQVHDCLLRVVENLRHCAKGELNVWGVKYPSVRFSPLSYLLTISISSPGSETRVERRPASPHVYRSILYRFVPYFLGPLSGPFLTLLCFLAKDPTSEPGELTEKSARTWRNLSTFGARCLGSGVVGPYYQAMDAL